MYGWSKAEEFLRGLFSFLKGRAEQPMGIYQCAWRWQMWTGDSLSALETVDGGPKLERRGLHSPTRLAKTRASLVAILQK